MGRHRDSLLRAILVAIGYNNEGACFPRVREMNVRLKVLCYDAKREGNLKLQHF